ncbi:PEX10 [Candida pseudojiufengensis]|uniref:PEX10 n=1 Tax=Candida pseudojiufengensis TaxID=497109 RepID=UPI0022258D06|nr:PEX10 [Candida pseudojiufengensis]KAI5959387.1 PEX10 [Candida pseudojiufengensis]
MSQEKQLPFADAATIVRAHQKDVYFESSYRDHLQDLFQILKGQRFVNTYSKEITVLAKAIYIGLTSLIGARTLGEEYVDLIYVTKSGKKLPRFLPRLGFLVSYAIVPYLINRFIKYLRIKKEQEFELSKTDEKSDSTSNWIIKFLSNYYSVLDTLLNLHIAIFYFKGEFYSLSKRFFGLRYAFGHHKEPEKMKRGNYSLLGGLIIIQFLVEMLLKVKEYNDDLINNEKSPKEKTINENTLDQNTELRIDNIKQLNELSENFDSKILIDLNDSKQLPYLEDNSRNCMLCLSPMITPSAANCGHLYCWDCIVDWIRENPECPLCRQQCLEQHLLPLR